MKPKYRCCLLFMLCLSLMTNAQTAQKGAEAAQERPAIDWLKDIDYLATELPKRHINLFALKTPAYFQAGLEAIRNTCIHASDLEVAVRLQQLIASMGDSHTSVRYQAYLSPTSLLPLQVYWFKDGIHVITTSNEHASLIGKRIMSVNGTPVEVVMDSLSTLVTKDNEATVKSSIPSVLAAPSLLHIFGFAEKDDVTFGLADAQGQPSTVTLTPLLLNRQNTASHDPTKMPFCFRNQRSHFLDTLYQDDRLYYVQYNKCVSRESETQYGNPANAASLPSFKEFESNVLQTLATQPVRKLVFDMRFNSGGSSPQGTALIEKLASFQRKHPHLAIYVVLGRRTFSSAILNAQDFKRLTKCTWIGEETSGKPNHFGEVRSFTLPSSGIVVNYSTKYFRRSKEALHSLVPDVVIEADYQTFSQGIDPVLEWAIKQ